MPYQWTNEEARELGRNHGYNAANYAEAYGEPVPEFPDRDHSAPIMSNETYDYYASGWNEGIEQYTTYMAESEEANPDNACASNGTDRNGRPYHYDPAHNGYVYDA